MKKKKITKGRGQKIAKDFLEVLHNSETSETFMTSLTKIAPYYPEIRESFLKVAKEYEKEKVEERLMDVRMLLKGGSI